MPELDLFASSPRNNSPGSGVSGRSSIRLQIVRIDVSASRDGMGKFSPVPPDSSGSKAGPDRLKMTKRAARQETYHLLIIYIISAR